MPKVPDVSLWDHYIKFLPTLILALAGGLVKVIQAPEEFSILRLITGLVTAAFMGMLLYLALSDLENLSETTKAAIIGVGGYAAGDLLPALQKILKRWLNSNWLNRG